MLAISWSNHAIERVHERFGDLPDIEIPTGIIQAVGVRKAIGETFHVKQGLVTYKLARVDSGVLVITVLNEKTPYYGNKNKAAKRIKARKAK
jgi:hypothetical protein